MRRTSALALGLLGLLGTAASACSTVGSAVSLPGGTAAPTVVNVGIVQDGRVVVRQVALDDYVLATALSEFAPPSGDAARVGRMFEVQAVISRTYALAHLGRHAADGFDLCATTHCQLYQPDRVRTSRWAAPAGEAVRRSTGIVLSFNGAPASALFHADCGGRTSRATDVWGGRGAPYLASVVDGGAASLAHTGWRYEIAMDAAGRVLNADARTRVGALAGVAIAARDAGGRAERVRLDAQAPRVVRGEDLRDVLTRHMGIRTIRSTLFDVHVSGTTLVFEGRGFGHGVGLCQAGAYARVSAGETPEGVLTHYYPGARLLPLASPLYTRAIRPGVAGSFDLAAALFRR